MHVRKRIFAFLFAAFVMLLCTACGKWDYSREAMKAANDAQGENVRVTFEIDQKFTSSLRGAAEDNIQPADVKNAMAMDKTIEKLLTAGYRLDIYALRADTDAAKAAAQLADEFASRLAGCEEKGYISMVKADNGYFYEAVLVYKHGGNGGAGTGSGSDSDHPDDEGSDDPTDDDEEEKPNEDAWVTLEDGTLTFWPGASDYIGSKLQDDTELITTIEEALKTQEQLTGDTFSFSDVEQLVVKSESGIKTIGNATFRNSTELESIDLEGVTKIEQFAFAGCSSLASIKKLTNVETIMFNAFASCSLLSGTLDGSILPNIKTIGDNAFSQTSFTEVDLSTVETLGGFRSCSNLTSVKASSATEILKGTFQSCSSLVMVYIPEVTTIGENAFRGCSMLKSLNLPNVKVIKSEAFFNCGLEKIGFGSQLTSKLTSIGKAAFGKDQPTPSNRYEAPIVYYGTTENQFRDDLTDGTIKIPDVTTGDWEEKRNIIFKRDRDFVLEDEAFQFPKYTGSEFDAQNKLKLFGF